MIHPAVLERTKQEKALGRRLVKQRAAEDVQKQRAAEDVQKKIVEDMQAALRAEKATPIPMEHNREPTEPACYIPAPAGYIYLPDEIRSCIARGEAMFQSVYHPPFLTKVRRWIVRKLWR